MNRRIPALLLCLGLFCRYSMAAPDDAAAPVVLVSVAPVQQLAAGLLENTPVDLRLLPDTPRSMQAQATLFTRQADRYTTDFAAADAVISIGQVWRTDPLYISTREINIRAVNIDASKPWSHTLDGVAVATSPVTSEISPWFWLSPSNVIRSLDILGADLQRLYPVAAAQISSNLSARKNDYLQLKADFELKLLAAEDPAVYALADEFVYLTSDLGIFVDDYFVKQDIDWTMEDYQRLTENLVAGNIRVVVHKWEPADPIRAAIAAAGARLVVLDTLETTTDFYSGLQQNLQALLAAFIPAE